MTPADQKFGAGSALSLSAAKATYGHAETGAGAVGLSRVLHSLASHAQPPILHLRGLNSYVSGILETAQEQRKGTGQYLHFQNPPCQWWHASINLYCDLLTITSPHLDLWGEHKVVWW